MKTILIAVLGVVLTSNALQTQAQKRMQALAQVSAKAAMEEAKTAYIDWWGDGDLTSCGCGGNDEEEEVTPPIVVVVPDDNTEDSGTGSGAGSDSSCGCHDDDN